MKKLTQRALALLTSAVLAGGCMLTASAENIPYGDLNSDGCINSIDALEVLEFSVGKTPLDEAKFKIADVNGDGFVNSTDALDILCYYVGLKAEFDVEGAVDMKANEILAMYNSAVKKARESRPEYLFESGSQCTEADVSVKDPLGLLKTAGGVSAKEMEEMMLESLLAETEPVKRVMPKGSTNSYANLPAESNLTDASKLKSITASELEDGNYRIVIKLNDEKNPSADSIACKVLGTADYETALKELTEESEVEGAEGLTDVSVDELSYKNAEIVCILNPENSEIVDFTMEADMYMKNTVKISAIIETITVKSASNIHNTVHYSYFSY